ncbi:hypothetical protein [Nocardioides sp. HDW12B]|uniref:hypothetical protein n=1 Tax=Nocardioides sp. HDW12B TaxID=2714939 RepID=UPI00197FA511|nr:hypothetical protein [Nocardioides sp. HDW12B]
MPTTDPDAGRSGDARENGRVLLPLLAVVVVVVLGVALAVRLGAGPFPDSEVCRAEVGDVTAELSGEQAENASLIAGIGVRRGLPARAVSIALATAFQESKLENLEGGDRDSLGLFQQRPSQGWGSAEQISDPVYATNAFYDGLVEIEGYEDMRITEAAQAVQRSGFPEAYEEHAEGARALASALTGYSPGAFSCVVRHGDLEAEEPGERGLTARAEAAVVDVERVFGELPLGGFSPEGVTTGHMEGSAHYAGRAVDVFFRPVNDANLRRGWAVAQYLVANAERLGVDHVIFDDRIWSSGLRSEQGWRDYDAPVESSTAPATRVILEHRDHVHLDVVEGG